ncbi:MAG TPA: S41 family peptidase, partial [Verrucomicrobiota bacterium]|nr:S41 family peptidase [Verrucomicrobiota bacterium]
MKRIKSFFVIFLVSLTVSLFAQGDNETVKFKELYDIIKNRVPEISESQIEAAAVEGILNKFSNYVHIVSEDSAQQTNQTTIKTLLFEENIAYFKFTNINHESSEKFLNLLSEIEKTNKLKGIILDLRFCGGKDYSAAAKLADLFFSEEKPLFIAGDTKYNSTKKTKNVELPTIILVNSETSASAEAVAGALKDCKNILVIGNNTKGKAFTYSDIKLSNGKIL